MSFSLKMMSAALLAGILAFPVSAQEKKTVPAKIDFKASVDKKDAIYRKGEPIRFTVELKDSGSYPGAKIRYVLYHDGNPVKRGSESADKVLNLESKLDQPGWVMLSAELIGEDGTPVKLSAKNNAKTGIGAMVDPLEIKDAGCEPADFDQFWQKQRKELDKVPVKAKRTRVAVPKKWEGKVDVYDVQVDCAGGKPVSGYLSMPSNAKKGAYPVLVQYQGYGVWSARGNYGRAIHGMIVFEINAHGIPNGKPTEFYKELFQNELKGYPQFGKTSRETSYFKGMFLRVMRSLDYVKTLPEWDGKNLIVYGGSQGGGQAIAAAALDPQVTLCVANVPAIGDHGGRLVGRYAGWPRLFNRVKLTEEDKKGIAESSYFDHNYLAKRIKCETIMGTGFIDGVCPPTSVFAAYNNLPKLVKKSIQTTPDRGHNAQLTKGQKRISDFAPEKKAFPTKIDFKASVDKKDAIYKKGEPIRFTVKLKDAGAFSRAKIRYVLFHDGNPVKRGTEPADKVLNLESKLDQPGWVMLDAELIGEDGKPVKLSAKNNARTGIGAMVDPLEIKDAGCEPADFDQFWQKQRKELDKVPVKVKRTRVAVPKKWEGKVDVYDVQVDCAGEKPVSGYLAIPANAKKGSLPAYVYYHGAGVRSSYQRIHETAGKRITFDVNAHGIPNGKPAEFYKKLKDNELKGYPQFGKTSRETSYFKGIFLRVMRSLDYVKTLPEWDGKNLIVYGGSQGGGQAIAAAALDPQVTLCVANVPAIGDHGGRLVGRFAGWPRLFNSVNLTEEDKKGIAEAAYFDHNYFAKRIRCETYMGTGFIDRVCPPTSVYAAYNNLPKTVKKHMQTTPDMGHNAPRLKYYTKKK